MVWLTEQEILAAHHQFGKLNRKMVRIAMGPNWPPDWEYIGIFNDEHDDELRTMGTLADVIRDRHGVDSAARYMSSDYVFVCPLVGMYRCRKPDCKCEEQQ